MYGHEGASRDLTARIENRLHRRLASIRHEHQATTRQLPDPAIIRPYFLPDADTTKFPAVMITELDTPTGLTGSRGVTAETAYTVYSYRYPFRIWVYIRGTSYGAVELQLKRYLTGLRETILENLLLTDTDQASVKFDPSTLTENFYGPAEDTTRQVLGAGFVGVVLDSDELVNPAHGDPTPTDGGPYTIRTLIGARDRATGEGTGYRENPEVTTSHDPREDLPYPYG